MTDNTGERIASLEATLKIFRNETQRDNLYIRSKLDAIADSLSQKADRSYCQARHEKLDDRIVEVEKNGKREETLKRIRILEQKTPAIIQNAVLAVTIAVLTAIAIQMIP